MREETFAYLADIKKIITKATKRTKQTKSTVQTSPKWMNTYFEIFKVLLDLEFEKFEWCNFVYNFGSNILLLLYVDDIVIFGKTDEHINKVLILLKGRFDLKVLGKTKKLLGVEFEEHKGGKSFNLCSDPPNKLY